MSSDSKAPKRSAAKRGKYEQQWGRLYTKRLRKLRSHIQKQPQDEQARSALTRLVEAGPNTSKRR